MNFKLLSNIKQYFMVLMMSGGMLYIAPTTVRGDDSIEIPLPAVVDIGCGMLPVPLIVKDPSNITFDDVTINGIFNHNSSLIDIKANFTFSNSGSESNLIGIIFPFLCTLSEEVNVTVDKIDIPIFRFQDTLNYSQIPEPYNNTEFDIIGLNMTLEPGETKTVNMGYQREYQKWLWESKGGSIKAESYSLLYIVATARLWQNPITHAHFEFYIPSIIFERPISINNATISKVNATFEKAILGYDNWIPEYDGFIVAWVFIRKISVDDVGIELFVIPLSIVFLALWKKKYRIIIK